MHILGLVGEYGANCLNRDLQDFRMDRIRGWQHAGNAREISTIRQNLLEGGVGLTQKLG